MIVIMYELGVWFNFHKDPCGSTVCFMWFLLYYGTFPFWNLQNLFVQLCMTAQNPCRLATTTISLSNYRNVLISLPPSLLNLCSIIALRNKSTGQHVNNANLIVWEIVRSFLSVMIFLMAILSLCIVCSTSCLTLLPVGFTLLFLHFFTKTKLEEEEKEAMQKSCSSKQGDVK